MDTLAHGFWTNVAAQKLSRRDRLWAVFFGMMPDIPFLPELIKRIILGTAILHGSVPPEPLVFLYRLTHSALVFGLIFLAIWLLRGRRIYWPLLGWGFHIGIDILTHGKDYFPTEFLWPVSTLSVNGISWATPTFIVVNYLCLAVVYLALWLKPKFFVTQKPNS